MPTWRCRATERVMSTRHPPRHLSAPSSQARDLRGILGLLVSNAGQPVAALLIGPILTRTLSLDDRGLFATYLTQALLIGVIGTFGAQDGATHLIGERRLTTRQVLRALIRAAPIITLGDIVLLFGLWFAAGTIKGARIEHLGILIAVTLASVVTNILWGILVGRGELRTVRRSQLAAVVARLVSMVALMSVGAVSLTSSLLAFGLSVIVSLGIALRGLIALRPEHTSEVLSTSRRPVYVYSLQVFPTILFGVSLSRIDQTFGVPLVGASELAIYAVAVSVGEIPMTLAKAARMYYMGATVTRTSYRRSVLIAGCLSLVIGAAVALVTPWGVPMVFGAPYRGSIVPAEILCAASVFRTAQAVSTGLLVRVGHVRTTYVPNSVALVTNVVLLLSLRQLGATGMAIASLGAYAAGAASAHLRARRALRI